MLIEPLTQSTTPSAGSASFRPASLTAIAQQTHDNVVKSVFDTYSNSGFDASAQTGVDDHP